jgi:hypothetical protein
VAVVSKRGSFYTRCPVCERSFKVYHSRLANRRVFFCTRACYRKALAELWERYAQLCEQSLSEAA